jgi:FlaA1/EpsC-like NDP-sugar epimerase
VRIYDLARDVIRLSGLEEGNDIEILEVGMRPGEKLYEELFFDAENASPTAHPKVLRARSATLALDGPVGLDQLVAMARRGVPVDDLRAAIKLLVPEYTGVPDRPMHATARLSVPEPEPGRRPARALAQTGP